MNLTERVAKLEERVDSGFSHISEQLDDIKNNHMHDLRNDIKGLDKEQTKRFIKTNKKYSKMDSKLSSLTTKVSVIVGVITLIVNIAVQVFTK